MSHDLYAVYSTPSRLNDGYLVSNELIISSLEAEAVFLQFSSCFPEWPKFYLDSEIFLGK